jgi:hypothetical protein
MSITAYFRTQFVLYFILLSVNTRAVFGVFDFSNRNVHEVITRSNIKHQEVDEIRIAVITALRPDTLTPSSAEHLIYTVQFVEAVI